MSDDLVKRLWMLDMNPESVPRQAADRIEELEAERDALAEKLDRAIAEAEARGMERAADLHDETFCDKRAKKAYWQSDLIRAEAAAIRARTERDNTDD